MLSYQFIVLSLFSVSVSSIVSAKPLAVRRNSSSNLKSAGPSTIDVNGFVHVPDSPASFCQQTGQYGYMFSGSANNDITPTRHGDSSVMIGSVSNTDTNPTQQFQIECQTWNSDTPVGKWTGLCVQVDKVSDSNLSTSTGPASWRDEMDLPIAGIQDSAAQPTDPATGGNEPTPVVRAVIQARAIQMAEGDDSTLVARRAVQTPKVNPSLQPRAVQTPGSKPTTRPTLGARAVIPTMAM
ncbi:hypothetical protein Moror_7569 [Moniliophthora roreri MCA 2997]|uniref:Uncharacterized protein n=2 Tax=Moniliophthora roreri TaxID=221103 RepID=V2XWX3_MONRO|nr:hypothetical protein Moror_7569 [Moniliophthora roreri MCA 2997]